MKIFDNLLAALIIIGMLWVIIVLPLQCKRATLQRVVGHPVSMWDTIVFHN